MFVYQRVSDDFPFAEWYGEPCSTSHPILMLVHCTIVHSQLHSYQSPCSIDHIACACLRRQKPARNLPLDESFEASSGKSVEMVYPIGSMYAIYGNIYHQYTPNVSIYTIHGSYGYAYAFPTSPCGNSGRGVYSVGIGQHSILSNNPSSRKIPFNIDVTRPSFDENYIRMFVGYHWIYRLYHHYHTPIAILSCHLTS